MRIIKVLGVELLSFSLIEQILNAKGDMKK